jgi:hypothetical protein
MQNPGVERVARRLLGWIPIKPAAAVAGEDIERDLLRPPSTDTTL